MSKSYFRTTYSPFTYELDIKRSKIKSAIPKRYKNLASQVKIGDIFISYIIGISRFVGLHEITSKGKISDEFLYYEGDPYNLQFDIKDLILLPLEQTVPIFEPIIWDNFSITKGLERSNKKWSGSFMGSFAKLKYSDGQMLETILKQQHTNPTIYPITKKEKVAYNWHVKKGAEKLKSSQVEDEIDEIDEIEKDTPIITEEENEKTYYQSSIMQALISKIGYTLGFKIWNPPHDRNIIKEILKDIPDNAFIEELPYDISDVVKQIDVLWIDGRLIARAFEVEGTTSVYSGILRLSDLVEENPNINTSLHIVASSERKDKVFKELSRPTFSKLQSICSYLSYDIIEKLASNDDLEYFKMSVIDKYSEYPEYI